MERIHAILEELEEEFGLTRKVLERVGEEDLDWRPHEKSMSIRELSSHLADLPQWISVIMDLDEFEVDASFQPFRACSRLNILERFEKNVRQAKEILLSQSDDHLSSVWRFRKNGELALELPRAAVLRKFILNHMIHHRGQMTVYLRLSGAPVPALYGPSADELA